MIRTHDRYLLKAFWSAFGAVLLFLTTLTVILDMSERVSRLTRNWDSIIGYGYDPMQLLFEYYLTLIPFFWLRMLPFCAPAAALFSLARLNRYNELTPLVTAGVSVRRILLPIVLSSVVIAAMMMAFREQVVPRISRQHMQIDRVLSRSAPNRVGLVPHFHDLGGARLSADAFLPLAQRLEAVWLTFRDDEGRNTESFWYPELLWEDTREVWVAPRGGQRHVPIRGGEAGMRRIQLQPGVVAPLEAGLLLIELSTMQSETSYRLSFTESRMLLEASPANARFVIIHQSLWTTPLSCIVLLLLVLPFCVRIGRRGAMRGIMGGLGMIAAFYASGYVFGGIGGAGELNPIVLAWLPTVVFGSLGLALYFGMNE